MGVLLLAAIRLTASRSCGRIVLVVVELSRSGETLVLLVLKSFRSVCVRLSRPAGRPIVRPAGFPTVPRAAAFGSRVPAAFSAGRLVVLLSPIVRPIREAEFTLSERWFAADFFAVEIEGSFLPITSPMPRLLFALDVVAVLVLDETEDLLELTAGCFAPVGAAELRVPIELPIRERWLLVGCLFEFEVGGIPRLLELPMREVLLERAAGCSALLGTVGLAVSIVPPIRELMLGLILLLALNWLFVLILLLVLTLLFIRLFVLVVGLFVVVVRERLLDGVPVLMELPIRDDMLELIRLFVLGVVGRELIERLELIVLGARLVIARLEMLLDGVLVLIELPILEDMLGLIRVLVLGVVSREFIDRLEMLLLGARLVMDRLEMLLLGARLVIDLLEMLLLGARLVIDRLEVLLLGARLVIALLELRLDETLLELIEELGLDVALGAGAGLEACRVCLFELAALLLADRFVAASTGSQNNKSANKTQEKRKKEPSRRNSPILPFNFLLPASDF